MKLATFLCGLAVVACCIDAIEKSREERPRPKLTATNPLTMQRDTNPMLIVIDNPFHPYPATVHAVTRFCDMLVDCPSPIEVRVWEREKMPRDAYAFTTRNEYDENGTGCRLHFMVDSALDGTVIAHEVCHCKNDHEIIDGVGFKKGLTDAQTMGRERDAKQCAERLTR